MLDFLIDRDVQESFLQGLRTTLRITSVSAVFSLIIGFILAFARVSASRWLCWPAAAYVETFRNTPLLIQLYIFYRGLQSLGVILAPETCGVLALSLYTGAYLTEVFRSGLLAIPREQTDAGLSLGFSRFSVYRMILIPQAIRMILPSVGNQLVSLAKNSSLVAFITVNDLFYVVYKGAVDYFMPLEYFLEGALLYLTVSLAISGIVRAVETMISRPVAGYGGGREAMSHG